MKHSLNDYFKGCLYFTAGSLYRRVERMAVGVFSGLDIAPIHAFIMMAVADAKGSGKSLSLSDIAKVMDLDKSTVTRHMDVLEKKNLILRTRGGRQVTVSLTKEGARLIPKIEAAWSKLYQQYANYWGESKANSVNDHIYKLVSSKKAQA